MVELHGIRSKKLGAEFYRTDPEYIMAPNFFHIVINIHELSKWYYLDP